MLLKKAVEDLQNNMGRLSIKRKSEIPLLVDCRYGLVGTVENQNIQRRFVVINWRKCALHDQ
jgi:hypothetical protein